MSIGIESIACHAPKYYLDLDDLAEARGVEPSKCSHGIGTRKMAKATPAEDSAYLAVNAAKKAPFKLDIDYADIGSLVVGTETGVDHSKPAAVYLHEALGLRSNCIAFESKHACFGATAAISSAVGWIASGRAAGSKALVVAVDVARYGIKTAGEPTQGAGAVAMVISDRPALLSLDPVFGGDFTKNVMYFWRPLYGREAVTDGHHSIACYLEALAGVLLADAGPGFPGVDELEACLYHMPFSRMALKAHYGHHEFALGTELIKGSVESVAALASYEAKTEPWLSLNREIGNIYTGSMYLSLLDLLKKASLSEGVPISLFSYRGGSAASIRLGRTMAGYSRLKEAIDPTPELATRVRLSVAEYEEIMAEGDHVVGGSDLINPANWDLEVRDNFLYLGNKDHVRQYAGMS